MRIAIVFLLLTHLTALLTALSAQTRVEPGDTVRSRLGARNASGVVLALPYDTIVLMLDHPHDVTAISRSPVTRLETKRVSKPAAGSGAIVGGGLLGSLGLAAALAWTRECEG